VKNVEPKKFKWVLFKHFLALFYLTLADSRNYMNMGMLVFFLGMKLPLSLL